MPARGAGGVITGWWSTGSCSGPGRAARGVTCPVSTGTGRPSITGIAAGRWTGPGRSSWAGCGPGAMRPRGRTGPSARTPPWSGRTSTRPGPGTRCPRSWSAGAPPNDKNPAPRPGREALGRSRGGLSTKIHLAAGRRCRPVTRILTPGQHGDSPQFIPLLEAIRIARRGKGRPRTRAGRAMGDKAYSSAANRAWLRRRGIAAVIPVKEDQKKHRRARGRPAGGRPPSTPRAIRSATPSSAASASSSSSAPSRPATTSATSCTRAPLTSPRSGSGYEIPFHDLRDTRPSGSRRAMRSGC